MARTGSAALPLTSQKPPSWPHADIWHTLGPSGSCRGGKPCGDTCEDLGKRGAVAFLQTKSRGKSCHIVSYSVTISVFSLGGWRKGRRGCV